MDNITKSDTMKYVNSVSVSPDTLALKVGDWFYDVEVEVCPEDADLREVRWCSDNPDVARVDSSGRISNLKKA